MTLLAHIGPQADDRPTFFRSATGSRAHLPDCPHLNGTDAHVAEDAELLALPVCEWSVAQIEGYGREHMASIDDAMRRIGVPVQSHDEIVQRLKFVTHDDVYVVHSLTYAALGCEGRVVAGFGKTYYWVGDIRVNLPGYVESSRSGHAARGAHGDVCPVHFEVMSLTGDCGSCL